MAGRLLLTAIFLGILGCASAPVGEEPDSNAHMGRDNIIETIDFTGKIVLQGTDPHLYAIISNEQRYFSLMENELGMQLRFDYRKKTVSVRGIVHEDAGRIGSSGLLEVLEILAVE